MHILVCIKHILDPEIPPKVFKVDPDTKRPVEGDAQRVIGPFEENALEVALQLKEAAGDAKVTVVTVGDPSAEEALRKALSVTADEAILVHDEQLGDTPDSFKIAAVLKAVADKLGDVDVVLCGRQAGDWDTGQVGGLLGEMLGYPVVPFVSHIDYQDGQLVLQRESEKGRERLQGPAPVVATVTNDESNVLRLAKVRDIMMANRKQITTWTLADLDATGVTEQEDAAEIQDLFIPESSSEIEFIEGEDGADKAAKLVARLRELKII